MNLNIGTGKRADDALLMSARRGGVELIAHTLVDTNGIPLRGAADERLEIRAAVIGNPDATHRIWISTGAHGVERFGGTLFLCWLFEQKEAVCRLLGKNICIIAVDNLSPWGSSYLSRFTEEGVDLNRNFRRFDKGERLRPLPRLYQKLDGALNPDEMTLFSEISRIKEIIDFRALRGDRAMMKIIRLGQRNDPDRLLYVGRRPVWSNLTLREIIRRHAVSIPGHDVHIDIHSGLGPPLTDAEPTLVTIYRSESLEQRRAKMFFGNSVISAGETNDFTASSIGTIENAFFDELPHERVYTGVCVELGTIPIAWVVLFMRWRFLAQNRGKWKRRGLMQNITSHLVTRAFFPASDKWRRAVVPKLWKVLERTIEQLTSSVR